jgi:hypothetical protein
METIKNLIKNVEHNKSTYFEHLIVIGAVGFTEDASYTVLHPNGKFNNIKRELIPIEVLEKFSNMYFTEVKQ